MNMHQLAAPVLQEAAVEAPCLSPRETEHSTDYGDMRTVGKGLVERKSKQRGIFLGHTLRLGYLIGILDKEGRFLISGESFLEKDEMCGRWTLEE